jgi:hypothetical protein
MAKLPTTKVVFSRVKTARFANPAQSLQTVQLDPRLMSVVTDAGIALQADFINLRC